MVLLGLSVAEFITLLGVLGGLITALYLLDQRRRKQVVSTLKFWTSASTAMQRQDRKRVREPWSLALQLLSLALLLLAIAQLEWGRRSPARDHVLILDTSAWTAETSAGKTILDREKLAAEEYVRRLPVLDRVLVIRADSLTTPATPFTSDRVKIREAVNASTTEPRALQLNRAFAFAAEAQHLSRNPGEIVYIGPGMISSQPVDLPVSRDLRVIKVQPALGNCGIRKVVAARSNRDSSIWHIYVSLRNYGSNPRSVQVRAAFAGNTLALRQVTLGPGQEQQLEFALTANSAGRFTAEIEPHDALAIDDRAALELPVRARVRVSVFTTRPDLLRPLFDGDESLVASFYPPSEYRPDRTGDITVFDQFTPQQHLSVPVLWIDPPADDSPLPVSSMENGSEISSWHSASVLTAGLNERDLGLPQAEIFQTFEGDLTVASAPQGPVVVARPAGSGRPKFAVVGFDPFDKSLRFHITTPLLLANLLHWLAPGAFGAVEVEALPSGSPAERMSHLIPDGHIVYPALPGVAAVSWKPPPGVVTGLPARRFLREPVGFWRWLAALAAIALGIEWVVFGRRRGAHRRLVLKAAGFAVILLALAAPALRTPRTRVAAAVLVDTSASIQPADLARASSIATAITRTTHDNWARVIPFASGIQDLRPDQTRNGLHLENPSGAAGQATDLEAALIDGAAALPDGYVPRLVLISDGYENEGSATRAVSELAAAHVSVDTIPLNAHSQCGLLVSSVTMPTEAYTGERIPIELRVSAREAGRGTIKLYADGKPLGTQPVNLVEGQNNISVQAHVNSTGVTAISGHISAPSGEASFTQAIQLQRAHVLYVSGDPPESDANFIAVLRAAGFNISRSERLADDLGGIQLLVLNDVNLNSFTQSEKARIEEYVENGGGLLLIAGGRQVYRPYKQTDALDRTLPAQMAPPKRPDGTAVALIIDKSSSMEGRKIELARQSAIGVVNHLRRTDTIGVLMFDNSFQWAVPMRSAEDKTQINRSISGIVPDGGTQIAPALGEAYRKVLASKATYKHIVLLTDGISEEGDSFELAHDAQLHHVTISTVGLGQDVNRSYLEKVAAISGGHSYFLNEPQGLQQIVLKDVRNYTGSNTVEKPLKPIVEHKAEILDGIGIESAPPLKGYARFIAKPEAETVLSINSERKDPLYVEWQYGLGRAAVFTSDAKSRWAESWIAWPGFDKFWINISRNLVRQPDGEAESAFDAANGDITVRYRVPYNVHEPAALPGIFAIGPNGFEEPVDIEKAAPRLYEGHIHIGKRRGLFRIRPVEDLDAFPETGIYNGNQEASNYGTNGNLLAYIASATGGRFNPSPESVFDANGRVVYARLELWPGLLALAIALTIAELIARKWRGLIQALHRQN